VKFVFRNAARLEEIGEGGRLAQMLSSLRVQALSLERRLERDLLANHLLKNVKALMFAGALLDTPESRRWWELGETLLLRELAEQILPDGGHIERSPMYHAWILEHLADLADLIIAAERPSICTVELAHCVERMADSLRQILHPDGEIPLFNDSAFGFITRPTAEVLERVGVTATRLFYGGADVSVLRQTGYAVIRQPDSNSCVIFDCGPIGPDYQPGHGHCDVLSYELSLHGQRVVVDTGVSTYEVGPDRHYERSTGAHNTVRIDGAEQAEIWAGFRVGRRPRVGQIESGEVKGLIYVRGKHFGYQHLRVIHSRTIIHLPTASWVVVDVLQGNAYHRVESFVHLHPSIRVERWPRNVPTNADPKSGAWILHLGESRYLWKNLGVGEWCLKRGWYSPEFGRRDSQSVRLGTWDGQLPVARLYAFGPLDKNTLLEYRFTADLKAVVINTVPVPLEGE
jgi:uncharacterized heparinase superfamily protein